MAWRSSSCHGVNGAIGIYSVEKLLFQQAALPAPAGMYYRVQSSFTAKLKGHDVVLFLLALGRDRTVRWNQGTHQGGPIRHPAGDQRGITRIPLPRSTVPIRWRVRWARSIAGVHGSRRDSASVLGGPSRTKNVPIPAAARRQAPSSRRRCCMSTSISPPCGFFSARDAPGDCGRRPEWARVLHAT